MSVLWNVRGTRTYSGQVQTFSGDIAAKCEISAQYYVRALVPDPHLRSGPRGASLRSSLCRPWDLQRPGSCLKIIRRNFERHGNQNNLPAATTMQRQHLSSAQQPNAGTYLERDRCQVLGGCLGYDTTDAFAAWERDEQMVPVSCSLYVPM